MHYEMIIRILEKFLDENRIPQRLEEYNICLSKNEIEQQEIYAYNPDNKTITINLLMINNTVRTGDEQSELIDYALLCGLIEAYTTDKKNNTCGFGRIIVRNYYSELEYEGLTKAYIELLASRLLNRNVEENPNYVAMMLAQQLELIVGKKMLEALFKEDKDVLKKELQSIDTNISPKELLEVITQIQKKKSSYEDVQGIQNIFKELFVASTEKQEEKNNQELQPMQKKVDAYEAEMKKCFESGEKYVTITQKALEMKKQLQEEINYRQRQIKDMWAKFSNSIISKEMFDKYNGNQQK